MTSISDRCKTAREGAAPGPWIVGNTEDPNAVFVGQKYCNCCPENPALYGEVVTRASLQDAALVALAPEAADEVIRLHSEIEAMRDRCVQDMDRIKAKDQITPMDGARLSELVRKLLGLNYLLDPNPNGDTND